jgi:hypothetical protein
VAGESEVRLYTVRTARFAYCRSTMTSSEPFEFSRHPTAVTSGDDVANSSGSTSVSQKSSPSVNENE